MKNLKSRKKTPVIRAKVQAITLGQVFGKVTLKAVRLSSVTVTIGNFVNSHFRKCLSVTVSEINVESST